MKNTSKKWIVGSALLVVLGAMLVSGCRDPEFEAFHRPEGFNPDGDMIPAPLCPAGSSQPFNNFYSPTMGGEVYPDLTVEIFSYFRCQNCAGLAMLMEELWEERQDYKDYVRVYFHHFPLYEHETVMQLHAAAVAMQDQGDEYFWEIHDWNFEALNQVPPVVLYAEDFHDYAENIMMLDMDRYWEVFNDPQTQAYIIWDKDQGVAEDMLGTPGIFICGKPTIGGWGNIENAIDEYL